MTKEEIYEQIKKWIADGKLASKSGIIAKIGYWYDAWKLVGTGELFFTGNERVVATDKEVRDAFQSLLDEHRVMSLVDVTIRHPECKSANDVEKLVAAGVLLKVREISSAKLYIE